ncbi:hypothetical protein BC939DRAFT_453516 [Gamsiella multidivaricata]|uniref:uncharacterized protein n=1 Tax=Gamsiella multidivaricata TaxID=101098 RepID=UPI002220FF50|nr:uncharacterized protein BC939DRAFT_453516 [Gamsiella multidivaricata]KAI7822516.1 hypothetical protein BC939DRAFT_453516 [Gamsiella multidivaricata]
MLLVLMIWPRMGLTKECSRCSWLHQPNRSVSLFLCYIGPVVGARVESIRGGWRAGLVRIRGGVCECELWVRAQACVPE